MQIDLQNTKGVIVNNLNKTIRRSTQYWFDDGLVELLMGILFAVIGLLFWWQTTAASFESAVVGAIALPAIIIVGALLLGAALRWLKQRLVYPRTGYITYQKPTKKQRNLSWLLGAFVGVLVAVTVTQLALPQLTAAFIGAGIGIGLFMIGYRIGLIRFHLLAVWSVAVGVVISFLGVVDTLAATLALGLIGLGLIVSGGVVFWRYWQNSEPGNDDPAEALS